jgi:hypothetical protein
LKSTGESLRVGREIPVVIIGKYRPGKYSKFELKREILGNTGKYDF